MLKTVDLPLHRFLLYFLIVKSRVGTYQNNQKWSFFFLFFLENGGNLELEINLNAESTSAGLGGVRCGRRS